MHYRESMLRTLQRRLNYIWTTQTPPDLPMLAWVSLELGRDVSNAPDAWCELRESYMRRNRKHIRPVKNFERWLYQRDIDGVTTEPAKKFVRPWSHTLVTPPEWNIDYLARRGSRTGFAVDDRFLSGGPHRVAIKVTFHDLDDAGFSLVYHTPAGEVLRGVKVGHTGEVRTATFVLNDAVFGAKGMNFDFELRADGQAKPTISFVRIIKLGQK